MNCTLALSLIDLQMDELNSTEHEVELKRHLFSCRSCSHELQSLLQTRASIKSLGAPEISASFREKLHAELLDNLDDILVSPDPHLSLQRSLPLIWA